MFIDKTPIIDPIVNNLEIDRIDTPLIDYYNNMHLSRDYAKTFFCMIEFDNRIYFGHGDYDLNSGSLSGNSGTPIFCYNLLTRQFENEGIIPAEEINMYLKVGNYLYVTGNDAVSSNYPIYLYRRPIGGTWQKITIPYGAVHIFTMCEYHGAIYLGVGGDDTSFGTGRYKPFLLKSVDEGLTWTPIYCYDVTGNILKQYDTVAACGDKNRIYSLIVVNDELYAIYDSVTVMYENTTPYGNIVWKYTPDLNKCIQVKESFILTSKTYSMLRNSAAGGASLVNGLVNTSVFNGVTICRYVLYNLFNVYGTVSGTSLEKEGGLLFSIASDKSTKVITPYEGHGDPPYSQTNTHYYFGDTTIDRDYIWDYKIYDGKLYVLSDYVRCYHNGKTTMAVYNHIIGIFSTNDLANWTEHATFKSSCPARSFVIADGFAYCGMNQLVFQSAYSKLKNLNDGQIWKVKLKNL